MSLSQKTKWRFLIYIIPIPVFFTTRGFFKGSSFDDLFALPVSLIFFIVAFLADMRFFKTLLIKENLIILINLIYSFLIFLITIIFSGSSMNPNLLIISIIPLTISFCVGYSLKPVLLEKNLNKVLDKMVVIFTLFSLAHLLSSFVSLGFIGSFVNRGEDSIFGLFSIYQKFVYYPTVLACLFIFSLMSSLRYKYIYSFILLINVFMVAAREAIFICLLGIIFAFILFIKKESILALGKFIIIAFIISSLVIYFIDPIKEMLDSAIFLTKIKNLKKSGDITAGRTGAIHEVFSNSKKDFKLLIGTGYLMDLGDFRSPHNQYLEILLRSGALGLAIFVILIIKTLCNIVKNVKLYKNTSMQDCIYGFSFVLFCLILISCNVNVPIRAPYTAILFGFLCGFFNNIKLNDDQCQYI